MLILGGTAEARALAAALANRPDMSVVSSLAGRVSNPRLPVGEVRIGGFGGAAGLAGWLTERGIEVLVDATHPYAARIRLSAAEAAVTTGLPHLRLERPGWHPQPGDEWHRVPDLASAVAAVPALGRRVLLTTGRQSLPAFWGLTDRWFLARVVDAPDEPVPEHVQLLRSRGPYQLADERELLRAHRIDLLVTKDSGGSLTEAKLVAARERGIPVLIIDRPVSPPLPAIVTTVPAAVRWVATQPG
ncbi:cobalt-precorrin-6A reductase [Natronosporangium hydrolyticum]|uniref:Cobalt-precorrin-6A reductase n=1 Tax=Natronosporangium hydrolyticum TaxID=2811111 RepID=A0A895Y8W3_9ACTN|nr:cobalt-precorrin-6A reductase [Natronosporangium hydrolyticum]QSB12755.1 cobalt-precorrin-6A reductase [Natronosporangium hydrolyticum]